MLDDESNDKVDRFYIFLDFIDNKFFDENINIIDVMVKLKKWLKFFLVGYKRINLKRRFKF